MARLITTENVPTWALSYLEYGLEGSDGLTDDEIAEIDKWIAENFPNGYVCDYHFDDANELCAFPLFGTACETIPVDFYEP